MSSALVAGIGNIFFGDDAFGCEVLREFMTDAELPEGARAIDFGIRSYDLAYAIAENPDVVVLVDAISRGGKAGTLFLLELDMASFDGEEPVSVDAHSLDPVKVLRMARVLGARPKKIFLIGCEPGVLESPDGLLGLSAPVAASVPKAVEMLKTLLREHYENKNIESGLAAA
ncbi:MAG TPA: hydrogenase maturation protease [Verrucomicrobiae bacterium]|nr:hydrogenase maturation protease [Verrucomicrobiae bacterium]